MESLYGGPVSHANKVQVACQWTSDQVRPGCGIAVFLRGFAVPAHANSLKPLSSAGFTGTSKQGVAGSSPAGPILFQ
jgi:hypothetical protein